MRRFDEGFGDSPTGDKVNPAAGSNILLLDALFSLILRLILLLDVLVKEGRLLPLDVVVAGLVDDDDAAAADDVDDSCGILTVTVSNPAGVVRSRLLLGLLLSNLVLIGEGTPLSFDEGGGGAATALL